MIEPSITEQNEPRHHLVIDINLMTKISDLTFSIKFSYINMLVWSPDAFNGR